jgi:hypothetical protein
MKQVLSASRSPWQRAYVERVIGTIRLWSFLGAMIILAGAEWAARSAEENRGRRS